jgi:hypothetical protein
MVTNSFGNRNFMQPMGWLSMHSWLALVFSLLGGGWGWGELLFVFLPCLILPLLLAQAKNGDQQFWKSKIHAANG